jgi:hypothetical protein
VIPGPSHSPLGWAAVLLIVVAYAHVILEIAVALLAIAVAARVMMSPAPGLIAAHLARQMQRRRAARELARQQAAPDPAGVAGSGARGGQGVIALLKALAAAIARSPAADRPFTGPFVTIHVPAPRRPGPYDQARPDGGRDAP